MTEYISNKLKLAVLGALAGGAGSRVANSRNMDSKQQITRAANARARAASDAAYARLLQASKERRDAMNFGIGAERVESMPTLSGRGKYKLGRQILSAVGGGVGGVAGGLGAALLTKSPYAAGAGAALGSSFGTDLGNGISNIVGMGTYTVKKNSIAPAGGVVPEGYEIPSFQSSGGTRVRHREYIRDIVVPGSPALFSNASQPINPGNLALFPWLSSIAAQYQQYEFMGLVFFFKTLSSDITAGGALGSVVMATDYDALSAPFASKVVMENSQYAVSAKPSCNQVHVIECDPQQAVTKLKFVRDASTSLTLSQDNRFYDVGNFQIATAGLPGLAGAVLGELWVSYDVMLYKPEIVNSLTSSVQHTVGTTNVTKSNIFGDAPVTTGVSLAVPSGNNLTFNNPGTYLITMVYNGTVWDIPAVAASAGSSIVLVSGAGPRPGTITNITWLFLATIGAPAALVTFNWATTVSISSCITNITPANSFVS